MSVAEYEEISLDLNVTIKATEMHVVTMLTQFIESSWIGFQQSQHNFQLMG